MRAFYIARIDFFSVKWYTFFGDYMKLKTREMIECSMFTAILCIFAPIAVPVGTVPVTMSLFAVILASVVLGTKKSVITVCVYLLLGLVGVPVYSFFTAGIQILLGPTGGYLWSYIFVAVICGWVSEINRNNKCLTFIGVILSLVLCYICGTLQFMLVCKTGISEAIGICVAPFVVFDFIKAFAAVWIGRKIRIKYISYFS